MKHILILLAVLALYVPAAAPVHAAPETELDRIVAVVNDDVVTNTELEQRLTAVTRQLQQRNTPAPPRDVLRRQVLERLVLDRIQLKLAQQLGIRVDDEELNKVLNNIAAENHLSLDKFQATLEREGFNFAEFRENIRDEVIIARLRSRQVDNRIIVTPQEVNAFLETNAGRDDLNTEFHLFHILVAVPEAAGPAQVQAAKEKAQGILDRLRGGENFRQMAVSYSDGQQALEGGDLGWRKGGELPSLFADTVRKMEVGAISDLIRSPSGFHILKLEGKRGEQTHVVRQTHARHILIRTDAVTSDFDARKRLERLYDRIQAGDDFAELAKAHSDDKGSAPQGGDLGWVNPGDTVPAFEETMNRLAPGEVSKPFKSRFGWHIVQVLERRDHDNTKEYRRNQARQALRQRKIGEARENWLRRLRDEAYVDYRLND